MRLAPVGPELVAGSNECVEDDRGSAKFPIGNDRYGLSEAALDSPTPSIEFVCDPGLAAAVSGDGRRVFREPNAEAMTSVV